jgi:hypothetical protein
MSGLSTDHARHSGAVGREEPVTEILGSRDYITNGGTAIVVNDHVNGDTVRDVDASDGILSHELSLETSSPTDSLAVLVGNHQTVRAVGIAIFGAVLPPRSSREVVDNAVEIKGLRVREGHSWLLYCEDERC